MIRIINSPQPNSDCEGWGVNRVKVGGGQYNYSIGLIAKTPTVHLPIHRDDYLPLTTGLGININTETQLVAKSTSGGKLLQMVRKAPSLEEDQTIFFINYEISQNEVFVGQGVVLDNMDVISYHLSAPRDSYSRLSIILVGKNNQKPTSVEFHHGYFSGKTVTAQKYTLAPVIDPSQPIVPQNSDMNIIQASFGGNGQLSFGSPSKNLTAGTQGLPEIETDIYKVEKPNYPALLDLKRIDLKTLPSI